MSNQKPLSLAIRLSREKNSRNAPGQRSASDVRRSIFSSEGSMAGIESWARDVCVLMKSKRIVVMGFMGSMPIAGVVWQHIHYIVGLQRLGHDVYYIEDSARLPYNPETFEVNNEFDYAGQLLQHLAAEFGFRRRWSFCARYLPGNPTAGLPLPRIRQLYREADAILNVCGTQEFN